MHIIHCSIPSDLSGMLKKTKNLNEKLNSICGLLGGVRTFSWTKLLFLDYVYTQVGSFHQVTF